MKPLDKLPANHTAALDIICGGNPELLRFREKALAYLAERYPGLSAEQHLALVRAGFEKFLEGVRTERARVAALAKILRPETRELVARAIVEGQTVNDILDAGIRTRVTAVKGRCNTCTTH